MTVYTKIFHLVLNYFNVFRFRSTGFIFFPKSLVRGLRAKETVICDSLQRRKRKNKKRKENEKEIGTNACRIENKTLLQKLK